MRQRGLSGFKDERSLQRRRGGLPAARPGANLAPHTNKESSMAINPSLSALVLLAVIPCVVVPLLVLGYLFLKERRK